MANEEVPAVVGELVARLAEAKPMRRGSVAERWMKCGQKSCRCQHDPQARHGPYYSLTRSEDGKTQSRYLSAPQAELARQQLQAGQQFRQDVQAYWQACEQWADERLDAPEASSPEAVQKRGSKKPSARRSSPRSKRS